MSISSYIDNIEKRDLMNLKIKKKSISHQR